MASGRDILTGDPKNICSSLSVCRWLTTKSAQSFHFFLINCRRAEKAKSASRQGGYTKPLGSRLLLILQSAIRSKRWLIPKGTWDCMCGGGGGGAAFIANRNSNYEMENNN